VRRTRERDLLLGTRSATSACVTGPGASRVTPSSKISTTISAVRRAYASATMIAAVVSVAPSSVTRAPDAICQRTTDQRSHDRSAAEPREHLAGHDNREPRALTR